MDAKTVLPSPTTASSRRPWTTLLGIAALGGAAVLATLVALPSSAEAAEAPVLLGRAGSFSVLAGSEITNTGPSVITGNVGVHPGSAISGLTGLPDGTVLGVQHAANAVALGAKAALSTAYTDAAGRTPFTLLANELGGTTQLPGVYRAAEAQVTGPLTLNAQGDPTAVFIFQVSSTLTTASNSSVRLINGAQPCNVFWQVSSSATLGTDTDFVGTILASTSIALQSGTSVIGRAFAQTGAVTLDNNVITRPICAPVTTTSASSGSASTTTSSGVPTSATSGSSAAPTSAGAGGSGTGTGTGAGTGVGGGAGGLPTGPDGRVLRTGVGLDNTVGGGAGGGAGGGSGGGSGSGRDTDLALTGFAPLPLMVVGGLLFVVGGLLLSAGPVGARVRRLRQPHRHG